MNIKKYLLLIPVLLLITSFVNLLQVTNASALTCPTGQFLHSDNLCWYQKNPKCSGSINQYGNCTGSQQCAQGDGVYSSANKKCNRYAGLPKRDDGLAVNKNDIDCGSDGREYHASDGKCWEVKYHKVTGENEQTCKGVGDFTDANNAVDFKNVQAHWDNGTCWIADGLTGNSFEPKKVNVPGYCDAQFSGADVATCKQGASNSSCDGLDTKRANKNGVIYDSEKDKCIAGQVARLCGVTKKDGAAKAINNEELECIDQATQCLEKGGDLNARKACLSKVKNIDQDAVDNLEENSNGKTSGNSGGYNFSGEVCGKKNNNKPDPVKTNIIKCDAGTEAGIPVIVTVLTLILSVLTAIVGIVAVGGIGYAATLYASAEDNAGQVSRAKEIMRDVVIGLLLYGFMVAITNWLIPGGIIK